MTSGLRASPAFYVPDPLPTGVVLAVPAAIAGIYRQAQSALAAALEEAGLAVACQPGGVYVTVETPRPGWNAVAFLRLGRPGFTSELRFCLSIAPGFTVTLTDQPARFERFAGVIAECVARHYALLPR
ncbi:hypothetical protein ETD86_45850 [Nonomuraea turkmeniaca]|uniref:Uncharacterized protein n=1 Tax=Nonomuraea turkmeniaca TaxID=103838 RepID=A0A5S4EZ01_9ACTN|nr:hypothetical protein [Nonomuraea turkmeniaca]TMR08900.1 hypothetical protein ETD86_45850 [Nonomuraea turkmeniaca]